MRGKARTDFVQVNGRVTGKRARNRRSGLSGSDFSADLHTGFPQVRERLTFATPDPGRVPCRGEEGKGPRNAERRRQGCCGACRSWNKTEDTLRTGGDFSQPRMQNAGPGSGRAEARRGKRPRNAERRRQGCGGARRSRSMTEDTPRTGAGFQPTACRTPDPVYGGKNDMRQKQEERKTVK